MELDLRWPAGLRAYQLLTNLVVPRPIAWVSSVDGRGVVNLAPFSFFNLVGSAPPLVVIGVGNGADGRPKHTARNIAVMGEFVVNLVTEELVEAMNVSAADFPEGRSELEAARLHAAASAQVKVPRVAEAKASLECVLHKVERIGENNVVIGEVVGLHLADELVDENSGAVRVKGFAAVGRMGSSSWYTRTRDQFEVRRVSYAEWSGGGG